MMAANFKNVNEINNFLSKTGKNPGNNSNEQMEDIKLKLVESQVLTSTLQIVSIPPTENPKFQLHIRYGQILFEDPFSNLTKLQQTGSIREYQL